MDVGETNKKSKEKLATTNTAEGGEKCNNFLDNLLDFCLVHVWMMKMNSTKRQNLNLENREIEQHNRAVISMNCFVMFL